VKSHFSRIKGKSNNEAPKTSFFNSDKFLRAPPIVIA
jgi:hypothetical protein